MRKKTTNVALIKVKEIKWQIIVSITAGAGTLVRSWLIGHRRNS